MTYEERNAGWSPETGCHGKRVYLTKREAKAMSRLVTDKNVRFRGTPTHVYRCPGCGAYHVGHPIRGAA